MAEAPKKTPSRLAADDPSGSDYQQYSRALRRYLARHVRRPDDVADLTQDIFERFVRRKAREDVIRDPLAYLFRIAFHVVDDALATERRNPVAYDSELAESRSNYGAVLSEEEAEEAVITENVRRALAALPKGYLIALDLVAGQGLSYKEAAQLSGFSPNTIATYVMHGRAAIELALDGVWETTKRVRR